MSTFEQIDPIPRKPCTRPGLALHAAPQQMLLLPPQAGLYGRSCPRLSFHLGLSAQRLSARSPTWLRLTHRADRHSLKWPTSCYPDPSRVAADACGALAGGLRDLPDLPGSGYGAAAPLASLFSEPQAGNHCSRFARDRNHDKASIEPGIPHNLGFESPTPKKGECIFLGLRPPLRAQRRGPCPT
jgi:hypothetical protein